MALTDLTRISTSGIATGSTIDSPILRKDVDFRGDQVGVGSALFDSSERRLDFKDNVKLRFGDSGDLELYATGSNSTIAHNGDGNLIISTADGEKIYLDSSEIILRNAASTETLIKATPGIDGGVELYDGADNKRFETTSTGSIVTGILTATGHFSGQTYNTAGIATFYNLRVSNDLTVEGTTTTLDTNLIGVDRIEVGANSNTVVGVAITQSGTADIFNLYDGSTEVFSVADGGNVDVAGNILTRSDDNTAQFQHNAVKFQTSGGGHIDHETTNQNLNFRVTKSSAADTNMMQINAASEQTKFHKVVTVGLQGGGDTTQIGGGSGIGAYLQLNYASNSIVNTKLMGNNNSWLNSHYGNLGIGTQTAGVKLEIKGTAATLLRLDSSNAQGTSIRIRNSGTDKMYMGLAADFITGQSGNVTDSAIRASGALLFASGGGTERLRILSDGNVGIGTEIPTGKLEIADAAQTNLLILKRTAGNSGEFSVQLGGSDPGVLFSTSGISDDFVFRPGGNERLRITSGGQLELSKDQDGVTGRPTNRIVFKDTDSSVAANQPIGEISWYSTDAGMTNVNSYIRGINEATNGSGALLFGVKAAGSSEIEAMRIASDGRVGIGTDFIDANLTIHADAANQTAFTVHADMGSNNNRTFNLKTPATDSGSEPFVMQTSNALTVQIDTTERFRIHSDGKVGINTDCSGADGMFQVFGTGVLARFGNSVSSTYECLTIRNNTPGYPGISNDSSNDTLDLKSLGSVQATIDSNNNSTGKYFRVMTNGVGGAGTELFRVGDDGNVGIGTDNPSAELSIWSNSPNIKLQDTSPYVANQYGNISQSAGVLQLTGRGDGATHGSVYFYAQNNSETLNAYRITDSYHLWYTANNSNNVKMRLHNTGELQLDPDNTGPKLSNENQALKIDTGNGYVSVGPQNSSYSHFYTDRTRYYFNKKIIVDEGIISAYSDHDLVLTTGSAPGDTTTGLCVKNTSNYVGIGTNVPSTALDVRDTERAQGADYATLSMGSPSQPLRRVEIGARRSTRGGDWDNVGIGFKVHESNNHTDAPETKMVLDYDGNLGVGTSDPIGKLHISSGDANSDCVVIIQSDEDNNDENSNPQIWFKQDGDISAGLIGMSSNNLAFCNNIASSGGIIFKTGTTNNTGTTDPFTGSTEKFRIAADGDVGIGTNAISRGPLHINQQSNNDVQIHLTNYETGSTSSDGFTIFGGAGTNGRDMGLVNREEGGAIEFYTNQGGTVAQRMSLWTDNDITTLAINTPSDGIHSNFMVSNHDTTDYNGVVNRSEYPLYADIHFTGDATGDDVPTANRSKAGLRLDQEYQITNAHSNTSGERVQIYGIHSTMNATKYAYALNGAYLFASTTADDLPRTGTVIGVYGYAQGYINTSSSTKSCNIYGGHFISYRGGDTQGGHCYGVMARAHQVTSGETTKTGDLTGVLGEVEIDEGTVVNGYAVRSIIDLDDNTGNGHGASTLTTGYLYHGTYNVASNTTCTNRRGIWLNGCTDSYIQGDLEITGTLEKGTDNFRIPHPLVGLTTTKDLVHSVIEGPQMDLIYRGKVDLVGGTATINIDTKAGMTEGTFVSLCRDIQCFTSNETGWTAVKGSVTGNKITIIAQDNSCTDTISWMVVGERQDDNAKSATCTDNDGNLIVEPDRKPVVEFEKPECEDNMYNVDPNHNPADDGKD